MLKRFFRWFKKGNSPTAPAPEMLEGMLTMLANTSQDEISCDQVLQALAEYAERSRRGEDVAHLFPLVYKHLELCADCHEEYETLLQALDLEGQIFDWGENP
jgi:hypothetical protein